MLEQDILNSIQILKEWEGLGPHFSELAEALNLLRVGGESVDR